MSRPKAPCKDCPDRHEGCHAECEKYQAFSKACLNYNLKVGESRGYLNYFGEQKAESYYNKIRKKTEGSQMRTRNE